MRNIIYLVLVVSGAWAGCQGKQNNKLLDAKREADFSSHQEAVGLKSDDPTRPWTLKWALTEPTWNTGELFLAVHERPNRISPEPYYPESTAAIYTKIGKTLKLLQRLETDGRSYFLRPTVVWSVVGGEDREQLIQITEIFYGTGHITSEHIFSTRSRTKGAPGLELEEVGFTPADASFEEHLAPGEGVWKGVHSTC
jgi:hypothetical protein